ncbi:hypothetical protein CAPTEDRAFT_224826 [Capitella teleta]|uniref:C-type lectin domain-containing protein n=1 Tax=Capitella teleta TaxID=283909 RepID=R7UN49_CAPTE|nr:hypothetical protein CAPTEDRAFT_224826 [Capitella teleta]|eukprot:ELU07513.1 hypothetical protein CAPTEDRAFT_224826 [Capitella teleta]
MMRSSAGLHFALGLTVVILTSGYAEGDCVSGWNHIDVRCYKYFEKRKPFTDAKESCTNESAMLAKVDTQKVNDAVSEFVRNISGISEFWIGLTRANDQSEWRWMDGASSFIVWSKWEVDEPKARERCARLKLKAGRESRWYGISYKTPLLGALAAVAAIAVVLWIVALVLFIQRRKSLRNNPK